jgi:hypothetical protein
MFEKNSTKIFTQVISLVVRSEYSGHSPRPSLPTLDGPQFRNVLPTKPSPLQKLKPCDRTTWSSKGLQLSGPERASASARWVGGVRRRL